MNKILTKRSNGWQLCNSKDRMSDKRAAETMSEAHAILQSIK